MPSIDRTLAEISSSLSNDIMPSLSQLPEEINVGIAGYLDHESLVYLGETCSALQTLVSTELNSQWKLLHEKRWKSGKLLRLDGPPSQRPRNGIILNVEDRDWKVEFARRFILDKSVRERVERVPCDLLSLASQPEDIRTICASLVQDGADIYDKLKTLAIDQDQPINEKALAVMKHINQVETGALERSEWVTTASCIDVMMMMSKLRVLPGESREDLLGRDSPDQIYDEINRELDNLTREDLESFERVEAHNDDPTYFYLDKILKNRRGFTLFVDVISAKVTGAPLPTVEEFIGRMNAHVE